MKKIFTFFLCCIAMIAVKAQSPAEDTVNKIVFLLPGFVNGKVLFTSGTKQEVLLNYNTLFSQVIFEQNGVKMALDQINTVDTIYIDTMKFVPADTFFYEVRLEQTKLPLYIRYTCNVTKNGAATPFGGTTQTGVVQNLSNYRFGVATPYQLKVADNYTVNKLTEYFIRVNGQLTKIKSKKQLVSLFPGKEKPIREFIEDDDLDLNKQQDMEKIVLFIGRQK